MASRRVKFRCCRPRPLSRRKSRRRKWRGLAAGTYELTLGGATTPTPSSPRPTARPKPLRRRFHLSCYFLLRHLVTQLGCTHGAGRQGDRGVPLGRPWMGSHRSVCRAAAVRALGAAGPGYSARGTPIAPAPGAGGRRRAGDRDTRAGLSPQTVPHMNSTGARGRAVG